MTTAPSQMVWRGVTLGGKVSQQMAGRILKGLYSAALMFFGTLATVLQDSQTVGHITEGQWSTLIVFTLGAFGGTYGLAPWAGPTSISPPGPKP